jgi:hypothetical protein
MVTGKVEKPPRALAIGVSLAVHGLLALWLWRSPPGRLSDPRSPATIDMIEIDVRPIERSRPIEQLAPPGETAATRIPDTGSSAGADDARDDPAPRRRGWGAAAAAVPAAPAADTGDQAPAAVAEGPSAASDLGFSLNMRSDVPRLDGKTMERFERDGVIAPTVAPESGGRARGASFAERMAGRQRDAQARVNVFDGKVHPQLYDFGRAAERNFKPEEGHIYADSRSPNTVGRALRTWAKELFRADPGYLSAQRARAAEAARGREGNALDQADALRRYDQMIEANNIAVEPIACLICVVLKPGAPIKIELRTSSGNGEIDRAAVEAITRVTLRQPLETDVKAQRACYHFSAAVHRIPPLPVAGCGFDEVTRTFSCYYPTMRVLRTSVTLESVDYDGG